MQKRWNQHQVWVVNNNKINNKAMETITVVGSGLIGKSWTVLHTGAGYRVILNDVKQDLLDKALKDIRDMMHNLQKNKLLRGTLSIEDRMKLIEVDVNLQECVKKSTIIQECVFEDLDVKQKVFRQVDACLTASQFVFSSTSAILPSVLFAGLAHQSQFVIAHPVNPPALAPLVEIVPAPFTHENTTKKAYQIMNAIGQSPITLKKEIVGFGVNRLQYAMLGEAYNLVMDGVLSVEDVDKVVSDGLGLRWAFMGPLQVTHLNSDNIIRYNEVYGTMINGVAASLKPCPDLKDPKLQEKAKAMLDMIPEDKVASRRVYRDTALARLAQIKNELKPLEEASRVAKK